MPAGPDCTRRLDCNRQGRRSLELRGNMRGERTGTPEEIVIVFLGSESALYLTGQRVAVGGAYAAQ